MATRGKLEGIFYIGFAERRERGLHKGAICTPVLRKWHVQKVVRGSMRHYGPYKTLAEAQAQADL